MLGAVLSIHSLRTRQPFIDIRMLANNGALTVTYLRVGVMLMIVYSILYGFAQCLESAVGYTSSQAGLMMCHGRSPGRSRPSQVAEPRVFAHPF